MARLTKAQAEHAEEISLEVVREHMVELGLDKDVIAEWSAFIRYKNNAEKFGSWFANVVVKVSAFLAALAVIWNFIPWGHKP